MTEVWKLLLVTAQIDETETVLENAAAVAIYTAPLNPHATKETDWDGKLESVAHRHHIEAIFVNQPSLKDLREVLPKHSDLALEILPDINWVTQSQKGLKPISTERFFLYGDHARGRCPAGKIGIEVNAGEAFGSGHHGTTQGCLHMIERVLKHRTPQQILDLGCGTGVLAIGLAKATRAQIIASDIDPIAVKATRYNAQLNGVAGLLKTATARGFNHALIRSHAPYQLIVANILAGPLKRLAPDFYRHLAAQGDLILSGLLHHQTQSVLGHMRLAGFIKVDSLRCGEWTTLHLKR